LSIEIRKLDKGALAGRTTLFEYDSDRHYAVTLRACAEGWDIALRRTPFGQKFHKSETEKLVSPVKGDSEIHAAFIDGEEAGLIQIEHQRWNNSVRVWDIGVWKPFQRHGVGTALLDVAKKRARELGARRIVLETQTSNVKAVSFYRSCGFDLVGLDATHYTNDDVAKGEVRLEMAWHPNPPKP
jgi:ribosomal protein S18 acetylase RimI-like enzyme